MTDCSNSPEIVREQMPVYVHNCLMENLAYICYDAGYEKLYSGDVRADMEEFMDWAKEFEQLHEEEDWNESENDYFATLEEFTKVKINLFKIKHNMRIKEEWED